MKIIPVIFGFITSDSLNIYCARGYPSIEPLKERIIKLLDNLPRPFHAFNADFERGVLYHHTGRDVSFDKELQKERYEPKWRAVRELGIGQYDDPFLDNGLHCMNAWKRGDIEKAMIHNRACLLKERDILLKRGSRVSDNIAILG